ncbi:hypothetical protein [Asticcacaulis taihuensis]|uniref:hypothetical protein n=1 Tax=Asticcacaulis taihuensis TaxID=260084 RepID=UPI003F7CB191
MPLVEQFRDYIRKTKLKAADQGLQLLELNAEGICHCVLGKSKAYSEMDACHAAMEAERRPDDQTIPPRNGKTRNLTVLYKV